VIKIRYSDLPTGLYAQTVVAGRHVILYLLPGLSAEERRAAIRRARSNGQVGHGPRLSAAGLAAALAADRIRITIGNAVAAVRTHPGFFVPVMVVVLSAAVGYLFLSAISVPFRSPLAGPGTQKTSPATVAPRHSPSATAARRRQPGRRGKVPPGDPRVVVTGHRGWRPPPRFPQPPPPRDWPPPPAPPGQGHPPQPSRGPSPGPGPGPSPSPSPTGSGTCLDAGPLGVCIGL
jgi:hypothetical protein